MVISLNPMNIIFDTMIRIYNIKQTWGKHVKKWVELRRQIQNRKDENANPREKSVQGSLCPVPACLRIFPLSVAEVLQQQLVGQLAAFLGSVGGRPSWGRHLLSWMAVLGQGVGVPAIAVQSHSHGHQHRAVQQGAGSHCHPGGEGGGHHRPRLVIGGGAELGGPGVLHHNHSVDGFW